MKKNAYNIPGLFTIILKMVTSESDWPHLKGDYEEIYAGIHKNKGRISAGLWLIKQIINSSIIFFAESIIWSLIMIINYLKIAFRNLKRQPVFSIINISGLSLGIAVCILMLMWVYDDVSFDNFHENGDNIYRILAERKNPNSTTLFAYSPTPLGPALKDTYPEVVNFTRYICGFYAFPVYYEEKPFFDYKAGTADPSFFEVFSFPFVKGDPKTALVNNNSIVLSESFARKIFGDKDPMGKTVKLHNVEVMQVTGVIKDVPQNSHIQFDYIWPLDNMKNWWHEEMNSWKRETRFTTAIQLRKDADPEKLNDQIKNIAMENNPETIITRIIFQPLKKIHLYSKDIYDTDSYKSGNITYSYIFSLTAVLILLLACINFMNLSTSRSIARSKEVGIRKVSGAHRNELIQQFFGETFLFSILAMAAAIISIYLFLPVFNSLSGKELDFNIIGNRFVVSGLLLLIVLTGLFAGSYPALFLSAFRPSEVLKGTYSSGSNRTGIFRKVLVICQFAGAILITTSSIIIYSQLQFINDKDLGFARDNIISVNLRGDINTIRTELLKNPDIISLSSSMAPTSRLRGAILEDIEWAGMDPSAGVALLPKVVDEYFLETFDMKLVEGRFFSNKFPEDENNFLLNETAVKMMGLKNPVGKKLKHKPNWRMLRNDKGEGIIIGVIKDFHHQSLHGRINPIVLKKCNRWFRNHIRIRGGSIPETLKFIESKVKEISPGSPFSYEFFDDSVNSFYNNEFRTASIIKYSTIMIIFISCLGLFGLTAYSAERRTKEIGIRKILGASITSISVLLIRSFLKWIVLSTVIAVPVSWYFMNKWLENFAYHINPGPGLFLLAFFSVCLIAVLSTGYHVLKSARANPVNSLKYE